MTSPRVALALLACALVAACGPSTAKKTLCANNLRELWVCQIQFAKKEAGRTVLPSATGSAFWLAIQEVGAAANPPLDADVFVCPLSGKSGGKGVTTYRGPRKDINTLPESAVIGSCSGIHSDESMCVLKKDGSVRVVEKSSPLHQQAIAETAP
ncbi:MAG TPA: hypothetical protein VNM14_17875 [Planctomycetota bacterium]|nr:hypothetical protein [Planctomycetota bacterium]